jgi:peptidoglycan hydrolase CwlO-like protein
MKIKVLIGLLALVLLTVATASGCSSYASSDQVQSLQNQVNSLSNSLNSTQQQLASTQQQLTSTQQQLNSAQQSLAQAQAQSQQQQNTYTTSAQPVYPPTIIYRTYPSTTPWYQFPRYPQPTYPHR